MWTASDVLLVDIVKEEQSPTILAKSQHQRQCILEYNSRFEFNSDFLSQLNCNVYKSINETEFMEVGEPQLRQNLNELQQNFCTLNENFVSINEKPKKDLIFSQIYNFDKETKRCLKMLEYTLPKQVDHLRRAAKEISAQMKQEIWSLLIHMKQSLSVAKNEKTIEPSLRSTLNATENLYANLLHNLKLVLQMDFNFTTDFEGLNELPFLALDVAFYGIQTFILAAFSICRICVQLAENLFQDGYVEECNGFIIENFNTFKANLTNEGSSDDFDVRINSDDADFYLMERLGKLFKQALQVTAIKAHSTLAEGLHSRLESLREIDSFIQKSSLPVIPVQPESVVTNINFNESKIQAPFGKWEHCARVSYAIQYKSEGKVTKIGRWSKEYMVNEKACPVLQVPLDENARTRLIYRKIDQTTPQLVGVLENSSETRFHDINRELFELCDETYEAEIQKKFYKLLKSGADLNAKLESGRTVLHESAAKGNINFMPHILLSGNLDDIDLKDSAGYTPLHIAAAEGHLEFVALLLELSPAVNCQTNRELLTPLHLAAAKGHVTVVAALLKDIKIDINKKDNAGFTALHYAVLKQSAPIIEDLLASQKIDVNSKSKAGLTALHVAIITQSIAATEILLNHKHTDINCQNNVKISGLQLAVLTKNFKILELLKVCPQLDVNSTALNGFTALHFAILLRDVNLLNELLSLEHFDVNRKVAGDLTALHLAVLLNEKIILLTLLKAGIEIDARTKQTGFTALHFAVKFGRETLLQSLVEYGANLSLKTFDGSTTLELATYNETSHLACFRWLIEKGALMS